MALSCADCGATLRSGAAFCPACGGATLHGRRKVAAETRERAADERAGARLLTVVFVGVLAAILLPTQVDAFAEADSLPLGAVLLQSVGMVVVLVVGLWITDEPARRVLLGPRRPRPVDAARALAVGALAFGVAAAWAGVVNAWLAGDAPDLVDAGPAALLAALALAPVLEELLDRGLAWHGARRLGGDGLALVLTSILFATSHGLNGGWVLEFPHRLVGGFLLGWLRMRSGSVLPGIGAHFVWNALATWASSS